MGRMSAEYTTTQRQQRAKQAAQCAGKDGEPAGATWWHLVVQTKELSAKMYVLTEDCSEQYTPRILGSQLAT